MPWKLIGRIFGVRWSSWDSARQLLEGINLIVVKMLTFIWLNEEAKPWCRPFLLISWRNDVTNGLSFRLHHILRCLNANGTVMYFTVIRNFECEKVFNSKFRPKRSFDIPSNALNWTIHTHALNRIHKAPIFNEHISFYWFDKSELIIKLVTQLSQSDNNSIAFDQHLMLPGQIRFRFAADYERRLVKSDYFRCHTSWFYFVSFYGVSFCVLCNFHFRTVDVSFFSIFLVAI